MSHWSWIVNKILVYFSNYWIRLLVVSEGLSKIKPNLVHFESNWEETWFKFRIYLVYLGWWGNATLIIQKSVCALAFFFSNLLFYPSIDSSSYFGPPLNHSFSCTLPADIAQWPAFLFSLKTLSGYHPSATQICFISPFSNSPSILVIFLLLLLAPYFCYPLILVSLLLLLSYFTKKSKELNNLNIVTMFLLDMKFIWKSKDDCCLMHVLKINSFD